MTKSFFFQEKMKNKENLHLSLCAHVTSLHLLKIFQAEVLWQSRATRLWSLLWRWVRLLSILSHHSIFSFWLLPILSHNFLLGASHHFAFFNVSHCVRSWGSLGRWALSGRGRGGRQRLWVGASAYSRNFNALHLHMYLLSFFWYPPEFRKMTIF